MEEIFWRSTFNLVLCGALTLFTFMAGIQWALKKKLPKNAWILRGLYYIDKRHIYAISIYGILRLVIAVTLIFMQNGVWDWDSENNIPVRIFVSLASCTGLYFQLAGISFLISIPLSPLFLLILRYNKIICDKCFRYSIPSKSKYDNGIRYCEHCSNTLERTKDTGKVIFTFGENNLKPERRKFILSNPDFEKKNSPIDVSEVYIDTGSCDKHLLERFITYIVNYPPKNGIKSVQIFIRGTLDDLGHLKNSILNNFARVSQI